MKSALGLCAAYGMMLCGCGNDPAAGGGGFEGETVRWQGQLQTPEGAPLSYGTVLFRQAFSRAPELRHTADSAGNWTADLAKGNWILEGQGKVGTDSVGLFEHLDPVPSVLPLVTRTRPTKANASFWEGPVGSLELLGTGRKLQVGPGSYNLPSLPPGRYWGRWTSPDGALIRDLLLGKGIDTLANHPWLLAEDFEGTTTRSTLGAILPGGWWFVTSDAEVGGNSRTSPVVKGEDMRLTWDSTPANVFEGRRSLHIRLDLAPAVGNLGAWATVGFQFGQIEKPYDLSKLDSLVFYAKGPGKIRVLFPTVEIEKRRTFDDFGTDITLGATWQRVSIPRTAILPPIGSPAARDGLLWSVISKQTRYLSFDALEPMDLWLDRIEFHGVLLTDL